MDRGDIPEVLFSCIGEDDPYYRESKIFQIERWCYANWDLHAGYGEKRNNFLAQVLSSEDCWEKVNTLHGVKLDRQMVGKKLIVPGSDSNPNPFGTARYKIACRCCLEEDIRALFEERKGELSIQDDSSLLEYEHLVKCLKGDPLRVFWSHFISGYISKLGLKGHHPYEYGLDCAIDCRQVQAVEFFWDKIKSLPEDELSAQKKDEILMKNAVYTAAGRFGTYCDIFDFFFDQISPDRYPELLKRDLEKNVCYGSLNRMKEMLSFDKYQTLFDYLKPSDISEDYYNARLDSIEIQNYSGHYVSAAKKLFLHIWTREGFDSHRAFVINEEVMDKSAFFHKNLLVRWVEKGCMEPVWAVLDKLDSDQIKEFITYKQADHIRSVLEQGDHNLLNRFLAYSKSVSKDVNQDSMPGPGGDLSEVEFRRVYDQSNLGLGK